jgi:TPR repeat protein
MNGQRNLGCMLYSGRGCAKDNEEARKWIQKAADQGDAEAMKFLHAMSVSEQAK